VHPRGHAGLASAVAGVDARPSRRGRDVPPELDAACTGAIAPRADRIASARALGDQVQRFLDGDRDLALRKDLARSELDAARTAFELGNQRAAMQAAARALALDPSAGAAELVGRLMLEPPVETPPEVAAELLDSDLAALHAMKPLLTTTALTYLIGVVMLYWIGFRDGAAYAAMITVSLATAACSRFARGWGLVAGALAGHLAMLALVSHFMSPFLVMPGAAATIVMAAAAHTRFMSPRAAIVAGTATLLVPFALERVGVFAHTIEVVGGRIEIVTPVSELAPGPALVSLVALCVMLCTIAGVVAGKQARERREAQRRVFVQAWQLRQLVPG
jgi:serine/threonine-protein kinase